MLTRRHIRVKVMQSIYAFNQSNNDSLQVEQRFLTKSMEEMYDLFLLQLSLLVEIKKKAEDFIEKSQNKYLATDEDKNPNLRFVNNAVLQKIEATEELNELLEDRKLNHWQQDDEYVGILWEDLKKSELYEDYLKTRTSDFKEDKDFVIDLFKEIVAPNDKLYDYLEDKKLTWLDDLPIVNTSILKLLKKVKENDESIKIPKLFKSMDDIHHF